MAEDKKTFLQGKMNQDIDDRILPNGEYRSAQNIQVTTSDGSNVGSIQNVLGNTIIANSDPEFNNYSNIETIGSLFDEKTNTIFYFVTNFTCPNSEEKGLVGDSGGPRTASQEDNGDLFCAIYALPQTQNSSSDVKKLASGLYLNLSKTHKITGVNLLEDLLFWTDALNQPRRINVKTAISNSSYYNTEDKVSVAKFAPFTAPLLLDYTSTPLNGNIPTTGGISSMETSSQNNFPEDFLREKFVRFSYRYKFIDGEYSTIAPFTQHCFIPKTKNYNIADLQKIFKKGEIYFQDNIGVADGMVNSVTGIDLNIILPSSNIKTDFDIVGLEILYKESDNNLIRAVELVDLKDTDSASGVYQFKYKSTLPYKTLPNDQSTRVYDNVPLSAKAQEIVSNRVVYGNFVENRKLPNHNSGTSGLNFSVGLDVKYDISAFAGNSDLNNYYLHKEYPLHSIKQRRTYEVGVVLADKFGRQSPVLTSLTNNSSIEVPAKSSLFNSTSWDDFGVVSDFSPGSETYCGDALTITFNEAIPSSYGRGTLIPVNNEGSLITYEFDVWKATFWTEKLIAGGSQGGNGIAIELYYYSTQDNGLPITNVFYTNQNFTTPFVGYSEMYFRPAFQADTDTNTNVNKVTINPSNGAFVSMFSTSELISQSDLIPNNQPVVVSVAGSTANSFQGTEVLVTPEQEYIVDPVLGNVYKLTLTNFTATDLISVGEYAKGQQKDFVEILKIEQVDAVLVIYLEGPASLSYKNYTGSVDSPSSVEVATYFFYKYTIIPHGWYSYRVVVKQPEQEYYNVYSPGVISFDNERDENKTYFPIIGDSINKVTRDIEFTNTREVGLSTSKARVYPKVIPSTTDDASSKQSSLGLLDVISVGTAKEQDLKNDEELVYSFIYEPGKNSLMAQLPYGNDSISIGKNVNQNLSGVGVTIAGGGASDKTELDHAATVLVIKHDHLSDFELGSYLKGANQDLVKIIKAELVNNHTEITCDGQISTVNEGLVVNDIIYKYIKKYGVQDAISIFETKPVESVLDIYYETSTCGLVHELNEAVSLPSKIESLEFINKNLNEGVEYYLESNNTFTNTYVAEIRAIDQFGNEITPGTGTYQLASCQILTETGLFQPNSVLVSGNESYSTDLFEVVLDDNDGRFKVRPKQLSTPNNFYYSAIVKEVKYSFYIEVVNNNGDTEYFTLDIDLENVAPDVTSPDYVTVQSQPGQLIHKVEANNGSASTLNNQSGLSFRSSVPFAFSEQTENGNAVLYNTANEPLPIFISLQTGEIFLSEDFSGSLSEVIEIFVVDSDDYISNTLQDDQALFGGKRTLHLLNLTILDNLIVIEDDEFITQSSSTKIQDSVPIDVFNQLNNDITFNNTPIGTGTTYYNNYWTQTQTPLQIAAGMPLLDEDIFGKFIYSYSYGVSSTAGGNGLSSNRLVTKRAYALKIINNQPVILKYEFDWSNSTGSSESIQGGSGRLHNINHWLDYENQGLLIANNLTSSRDIDGGISQLQSTEDVDGGQVFWDPNLEGTHPEFGGNNSNSNSLTHGAFKYYSGNFDLQDQAIVSSSIAKPQNRFENVQNYMFKTKDNITINGFNYNILYEVAIPSTNQASFIGVVRPDIKKVLLCRTNE